jgi:hypothetical protein
MPATPGKPTIYAGQRKTQRNPLTGELPVKICEVEGCENEVLARWLCAKHYRRLMRHGDVGGP